MKIIKNPLLHNFFPNLLFKEVATIYLKTELLENGEGVLDKEATSHYDLFDAFRMSLQFWH